MRLFVSLLLIFTFVGGCRERYEMPFKQPDTGFLVVEGIINTNGITKITLSRTTPVSDRKILPESGAAIAIQGDDQSSYPLLETDSGVYRSQALNLSSAVNYRLHIDARGKEYVSSYAPVVQAPPLDSITWKRQNGGVEIFANSKGAPEQTQYYKWDYEETWEFHSRYRTNCYAVVTERPDQSPYVYIAKYRVLGFPMDSLYTCWKTALSSSIILGSSTKLTGNDIYLPVRLIPERAWELSVLYSIRLMQYGLSQEAYEFYGKMKKNTESLGSIFDAQPSELKGNLRCVNDDAEIVIGYIDVTTMTEKRIFINNAELPEWRYDQGCEAEMLVTPDSDSLLLYVVYGGRRPTAVLDGPPGKVKAAEAECVDCTLRGTNTKPDFWP